MFEIKISSTKDVRKIVIEFGDETVSSIDSVEPSNSKSSSSMLDRISPEPMNENSNKKSRKTVVPEDILTPSDIKERPPLVDETFAATEF